MQVNAYFIDKPSISVINDQHNKSYANNISKMKPDIYNNICFCIFFAKMKSNANLAVFFLRNFCILFEGFCL